MPGTIRTPSTPLFARFVPAGQFYGWYIAVACGLLMFVGVGVGYYGLPVFLKPLMDSNGWTTTQVSVAPAIYFTVAGITGALIGPLVDKRGPKQIMAYGVVINAVSAAFIGLVGELWQLYLVYFVFAIAYGMSSAVTVQAIMTRWFVRKRALAMSISSTGVSMGGMILAPIASKLIDVGGLELATPVLGAVVFVFGLPVVLFVIAGSPSDMGLTPDGDPPGAANPLISQRMRAQYRAWTRSEALRTVSFWAVFFAFLAVLIAQTGYIIHQVSFLEERFGSRTTATFTISLTAAGSVLARLIVGIFADNVDRRMLTVALFVIQATCVLLIVQFENLALTWVLTLIFGFTIGNIYMMQSLLVGEIFGMVSFGSIFGLVSMAGQIGSGLGPIMVGVLHDRADSYSVPFVVTAAITYLAAIVVLFARPVEAPEEQATPAGDSTLAREGG